MNLRRFDRQFFKTSHPSRSRSRSFVLSTETPYGRSTGRALKSTALVSRSTTATDRSGTIHFQVELVRKILRCDVGSVRRPPFPQSTVVGSKSKSRLAVQHG